jgi:PAS domain S-box-containing protein
MAVVNKLGRPDAAPALGRLLAESSLSRAALYACGFPVLLLDAVAPGKPISYANAAFEGFFGYPAFEAVGRPFGKLLFKADEALMQTLFVEPASRWEMKAWDKGGVQKQVEVALNALRDAEGRITHWVAAFADRTLSKQS